MKYDIYIISEKEKYHAFQSDWKYELNSRLFIEKNGVLYSLIVTKITHTIAGDEDIHRLTCQKKEYKNGDN